MFLAVVVAGLLLAQAPAGEEVKKPVLEGVVVQEGTGQPIAKASVTLVKVGAGDIDPPKVETSAEGTFQFADLAPGTYMVFAEKTGFARRAYGAKNDGALRGLPLRLSMGETRKIEVRLVKQGVIAGRVMDADGEPVQGVIVVALRPTYVRGKKVWLPAGAQTPQTNDVGEYRLPGLPTGKVIVCAMPLSLISGAGMTPAARKPGPSGKPEDSVVTCYPNMTERASAVPVDLADGAEVGGIDIRLARRVVVTVSGQITGLPSNVPQMIALSLVPKGAGVTGMMFSNRALSTGGEGKFEFRNVTPGSYVLHTLPLPTGAATFSVKMPLELGEDSVKGLNVPALHPMELEGRVVVEDREEPPGLGAVRVVLSAADEVHQVVPRATVKPEGAFTMAGVAPDRYVITLQGLPEGLYLKSARYGEQSWDDGTVEIGGAPAAFTLVLGDDAATVTGIAQDEKGEVKPGAYVALLDKAHRASRNKSARTDEKGVFRMTGVAPGEYLAIAVEELEPGGLDDQEYVKPWLAKAVAAKVEARTQPSFTLRVQP